MPRNAGDALDLGKSLCGHLIPLHNSGPGDPETLGHLGEHAPMSANKVHSVSHDPRLPEGSVTGKGKCLPLVPFLAATYWTMEIGHRIAAARTLAGMSQRDLARAVEVTPGLVGQWESHKKKPGRENLAKVARVTLVSMAYLMGDEPMDQQTITVSDADQIDLLRQYGRLNATQRQNLRQLLGMTIEVREHVEKHRSPSEREEIS